MEHWWTHCFWCFFLCFPFHSFWMKMLVVYEFDLTHNIVDANKNAESFFRTAIRENFIEHFKSKVFLCSAHRKCLREAIRHVLMKSDRIRRWANESMGIIARFYQFSFELKKCDWNWNDCDKKSAGYKFKPELSTNESSLSIARNFLFIWIIIPCLGRNNCSTNYSEFKNEPNATTNNSARAT